MFNAISGRYEFVNSVFSAGRDAFWRAKATQLAQVCPEDIVLDVACGTGDFARAFRTAGAARVVGCDFAHEMLLLAASPRSPRPNRPRAGNTWWCEADALRLPFPSSAFTITSCAFGVRNFDDLDTGFSEMRRVLAPGGRAVILEFSRPRNRLARRIYEFYSTRVMPLAATLLSGDRTGAYRYLPRSVVSFVEPDEMCTRLRHVGFDRVTLTPLTMGVVSVYIATRD
jgi:demethylmenaquinone methyltransferase/2-methoxy-6-polyprenyl-1,4-benzoquinol methylase